MEYKTEITTGKVPPERHNISLEGIEPQMMVNNTNEQDIKCIFPKQ